MPEVLLNLHQGFPGDCGNLWWTSALWALFAQGRKRSRTPSRPRETYGTSRSGTGISLTERKAPEEKVCQRGDSFFYHAASSVPAMSWWDSVARPSCSSSRQA